MPEFIEKLKNHYKGFSFITGFFINYPDKENRLSSEGLLKVFDIINKRNAVYLRTIFIDGITSCKFRFKEIYKFLDENERAQIATETIDRYPHQFLENFDYFRIQDQILLGNLAECLAKIRPDLFVENLDSFDIEESLKNRLLDESLPKLKYATAGKIRDVYSEFASRLEINESKSHTKIRWLHKNLPKLYHSVVDKISDVYNEFASRVGIIESKSSETVSSHIETINPESSNDFEEQILSNFKQFAENVAVEIYGRGLWGSSIRFDKMSCAIQNSHDMKVTLCGATDDALLKSIFGVDYEKKLQKLSLSNESHDFDRLTSEIQSNKSRLEQLPKNNFITYSFLLDGIRGLEHIFVVLQYLDKHNKVTYRILQSWLGEHTLKEYMESRSNPLTESEFDEFIVDFKNILLKSFSGHTLGMFFSKYFMHDPKYGGSTLKFPKWELTIKHGLSNLESMNVQKVKFEEFKNSHLIVPLDSKQ